MSRVFGYVRLPTAAVASVAERWRCRIIAHCATEGLSPELVFVDNGVPDTAWIRPRWAALLDILGVDDGLDDGPPLVILPSLAHLSSDPVALARMRTQLDRAGATTSTMPRTPPHCRRRDRTGQLPVARDRGTQTTD